jgi:hypothetical protein
MLVRMPLYQELTYPLLANVEGRIPHTVKGLLNLPLLFGHASGLRLHWRLLTPRRYWTLRPLTRGWRNTSRPPRTCAIFLVLFRLDVVQVVVESIGLLISAVEVVNEIGEGLCASSLLRVDLRVTFLA